VADVGLLPTGWEAVSVSMCWVHHSLRQSLVHIGQCLPNKSQPVTYDTVQALPERLCCFSVTVRHVAWTLTNRHFLSARCSSGLLCLLQDP
jgi:hypothetical protein